MYKNLIFTILLTAVTMTSVEAMDFKQQAKTPKVILVELIKTYPQDSQAAAKQLIALQVAIQDANRDLTGMLRLAIHAEIYDSQVYRALLDAGADTLQTYQGETPRAFLDNKIKVLATEINNIVEKELPELTEKLSQSRTYLSGKYSGVGASLGSYGDPRELVDLRGVMRDKRKKLEKLNSIAALLKQAEEQGKTAGAHDVIVGGAGNKLSDSPVLIAGAGKLLNDSPVLAAGAGYANVSELPTAPGGPSNMTK